MMPKATTLSVQTSGCRIVSTWEGSSSWIGVSCAIQMPNQAVAKRAIQPACTLRVGSAKGVNAGGRVGAVTAPQ
jgi:hypothetical protein